MPFNSTEYTESDVIKAFAAIGDTNEPTIDIFPETFVWGVLSSIEEPDVAEASFYTNNALSLYQLTNGVYVLDVDVSGKKKEETNASFLKRLLDDFTEYMTQAQLDMKAQVDWESCPAILTMQSTSISQIYTQFRIFVTGFCLCVDE